MPTLPSRVGPWAGADHAGLLDAVRVGLGLGPPAPPEPLELPAVFLALSHKVHGAVAAAADLVGARPDAQRLLDRARRWEEIMAAQNVAQMHRAYASLNEHEVPHLFFKGPAVAVLTGQSPADRPSGDVDLLIRPRDRVAAHQALTHAGFGLLQAPPPGDDTRTRFVVWSHCEAMYRNSTGIVDLHWRLMQNHIAELDPAHLLTQRVSVSVHGKSVSTLHPDAALACAALNGAKDQWRSLRPVVDAHLLLAHAGATWEAAAALVPKSRAIDECMAGVAALRVGNAQWRMDSRPHRTWTQGFVSGQPERPDRRSPRETLRNLRKRLTLAPSLRSTAAIVAHGMIPPWSLRDLPRPLWFLALAGSPIRVVRRITAGRWQTDTPKPPSTDSARGKR